MSLLSDALKARFAALDVHTAIHRHKQLSTTDELEQLSRSIRQADGRDTYGKGGAISEFEQQLCELFGKPDGLFLPTGTLAQCAAVKCYSESSGRNEIGLHPTSHLLIHEHMAIEHLWGLKAIEVGMPEDVLTAGDLSQLNPEKTAAIIVETPMREIGGVLPSWDELTEMRAWCDEYGVKMHLDGARIWQAEPYYERSLAEIAALFDSLYISFYKDLGGIFGAALLGTSEFIEQARIWARRAGGNPITLYPEVIAARSGLDKYLPKMPQLVDYTKQLAAALKLPDVDIIPEQPQVAMFHIRFRTNAETLAQKVISYAEKTGILVLPLPRDGDKQSCVCEISVGDQACAQLPSFWAEHLEICLHT